jgi:glycosyltransferase involved in cell wall biosynthesis
MPPHPRFCLNMIVRNEAAIIERALQSVVGVVDCCVIGDTGSTDGTQGVIRDFCATHGIACELHEFPFVDFSQARNEALARARQSPLAFDYLLLCDADMALKCDDVGALAMSDADAALVRQDSATITYENVRVLRRDADARYVGATHEALAVAGTIARLAGVHFIDHADGANRPEKLARDERLLRMALAQDPGDHRAMFYLAQTLRDAGHHAAAGSWYARRVAAGGWDEERWYARYQVALCQKQQGDVAGFVSGCLDAYALRPTRAEPLLHLARHYADTGAHDASLLMLEAAARLPWPAHDRLFIEREAYGDALRDSLAISGFYSAVPERREAGRRACDALAIDAGVSPQRRQTARGNLFFYVQPLTALCAEARLHAIEIDMPAPFVATNPSFVRDGHGYRGIVRGVNYRLQHGHYEIHDNAGVVRTRNFVVQLTADFSIVAMREVNDRSALSRVEGARIRGFEDCRLFRWREQWWCSATSRDTEPDARAVMMLLRLDDAGDFVEAWPLHGYGDDQNQKNWMPIVDDRLRFLYSCGPAIVVDASAADGSFVVESGYDPGLAIEHWRGGGPLLPWDAGWLAVLHEAKDTAHGREYAHRFVVLAADGVARSASDPFCFRKPGVEFAAGLAFNHDDSEVVVSFGAEDSMAWIATVPAGAVRALLRPLPARLQQDTAHSDEAAGAH